MIDSQTFPLCPPHAKLERTHGIRLDFGGCVQCRLNELAQLREKLALSKDALKIALRVIDSLHEQQAMEDNSFLTQREIVEQALAIIDGKDVLKEGEL